MSYPDPRPGLVLRYRYWWAREDRRGVTSGKDRPCSVVVAAENDGRKLHVYVMPITTKPPSAAPDALELTSFTKRRLGLDAAKCWVILDEVNWFIWHGPDLLPVDAAAGRYVYGELPLALTQRLRRELEERVEAGALKIVVRTR